MSRTRTIGDGVVGPAPPQGAADKQGPVLDSTLVGRTGAGGGSLASSETQQQEAPRHRLPHLQWWPSCRVSRPGPDATVAPEVAIPPKSQNHAPANSVTTAGKRAERGRRRWGRDRTGKPFPGQGGAHIELHHGSNPWSRTSEGPSRGTRLARRQAGVRLHFARVNRDRYDVKLTFPICPFPQVQGREHTIPFTKGQAEDLPSQACPSWGQATLEAGQRAGQWLGVRRRGRHGPKSGTAPPRFFPAGRHSVRGVGVSKPFPRPWLLFPGTRLAAHDWRPPGDNCPHEGCNVRSSRGE